MAENYLTTLYQQLANGNVRNILATDEREVFWSLEGTLQYVTHNLVQKSHCIQADRCDDYLLWNRRKQVLISLLSCNISQWGTKLCLPHF